MYIMFVKFQVNIKK